MILSYFERGQKIPDQSNRYPHRCKACGEDFPKGRMDTLVAHITRKCPAILESERIDACLALHGINGSSPHQRIQKADNQSNGTATTPLVQNQNDWSALQTLAEVSRRFDLNDKQDDHQAQIPIETTQGVIPNPLLAPVGPNSFELQEQFTLENPPMSYDNRPQRDQKDEPQTPDIEHQRDLTPEEKLQSLLQIEESSGESTVDANLSMAVAAAAAAAATSRLNPSYLDPQLHYLASDATAQSVDAVAPAPEMMAESTSPERAATTPVMGHASASPWTETMSEMKYIREGLQAPATVSDQSQQLAYTLNKGGFRMDTTSPNGSRHRHARSRFDSNRRKEVQEVRRIGACIRCRLLRKTCSKGTPCDTCRKVLSPRVWRTGCTRTKLAEQIELYSAGVQIVNTQKRVNKLKTDYVLSNNGVIIEASHCHDTGHKMVLQVLQGRPSAECQNGHAGSQAVIMIDNDAEDVPAKIEDYMRQILPEFISREPSPHVRAMLDCAAQVAQDTNDELLRRALELWGLVEMMDRERHWAFFRRTPGESHEGIWLTDEPPNDTFTNLCMQLTAAAERKAAATSKSLLNGIQRNLQDGKTKLGFPMFLTAMVFLNCVEKTTWAFKAWEGEILRPLWPLEKQPSDYYNQGYGLCDLLRMLLVIRHILPKVSYNDPDSPLVAEGDNEMIRQFYHDLNVTPNFLRSRHDQFSFDQSDSRSLEFLFCSTLLMP